MKLVIFDLDQTLVDVIFIHDEVTRRLFRTYFGVDARLTEIDFAGESLTGNLVKLARFKGVPEQAIRGSEKELLASYERLFDEIMPEDASKYILPGARELLAELSRTDNITALYTGSSRGIGVKVLRSTGLSQYFKFTFYGTEVERRADMVTQAIEKAAALTGKEFRGKNIVIVGDSVRDVQCGKLFDASTIAVSTGFHTVEQLAYLKPDYLFKDLKEYKEVLAAIS